PDKKFMVTVVDLEGREYKTSFFAHSSNRSVHVILTSFQFEGLVSENGPENDKFFFISQENTQTAIKHIKKRLVHEIGVMLGFPVLGKELGEKHGLSSTDNILDVRMKELSENKKLKKLTVKAVDLDTNLRTRDHAVGEENATGRKKIDERVTREKDLEFVSDYARRKGLVKRPLESVFNYKQKILELCKLLSLKVVTPDDLMPIEDRDFFLIDEDEIMNTLGKEHDVKFAKKVINEQTGETYEIPYFAHSNNSAVNIVFPSLWIKALTMEENDLKKEPEWKEAIGSTEKLKDIRNGAKVSIEYFIVCEIGEMLGFPMKGYGRLGSNAAYERYVDSQCNKKLETLNATVVELGMDLPTRDHAPDEETVNIQDNEASEDDIVKAMIDVGIMLVNKNADLAIPLKRRLSEEGVSPIEKTMINVGIMLVDKDPDGSYAGTLNERLRKGDLSRIEEILIEVGFMLADKDPDGYYAGTLKERLRKGDLLRIEEILIKVGFMLADKDPDGYYAVTLFKMLSKGDLSSIEEILIMVGMMLVNKNTDLAIPLRRVLADIEKRKEMVVIASEIGDRIARPVQNYTLFVAHNLYKDDREYTAEKDNLRCRFGIERISTDKTEEVVNNILEQIKVKGLDPNNVIVQLPAEFKSSGCLNDLHRLTDEGKGIKFMIIDTDGLKYAKKSSSYRKNIYSMMLLARNIDKNTTKDSGLYRLLSYFIGIHLGDVAGKEALLENYMEALMSYKIVAIIHTVLSWMPIERKEAPDPAIVSAALISA
ncbi:MAG: hypothetical protein KKG84_02085, partial [Candidatus Omnitrophica bacterium]|nr:hypothetical protein [Candidatus Omnitrophota bacterium]